MRIILRVNVVLNMTVVNSDLTQDFLCLIQALYLSLQLTTGRADVTFRSKQMVLLRNVSSEVTKTHFFKGQEKSMA